MSIDLTPLATIALLNLAAAMSPGPAFVLVTRTAAASTRQAAVQTAAGTVTASLIWATAALLGVEVLFARAAELYAGLQFAGGVYLAALGIRTWRHAADAIPADSDRSSSHVRSAFAKGLAVGLSNPKVAVFFGTIFTTVVTPAVPPIVRWASLLAILCNESLWYGTLALGFGSAPVRRFYSRIKTPLERGFAALLNGFGLKLLWDGIRDWSAARRGC